MDAATNRKLLFVLGPVVALVMFAATVKIVSVVLSTEYKAPYRVPSASVETTPRAAGLAAEKADAESKARAKPYQEAEYRTFPVVGSRVRQGIVLDGFLCCSCRPCPSSPRSASRGSRAVR